MGDTKSALKFIANPTFALQTGSIDAGIRLAGGDRGTRDILSDLNKAPGQDAARKADRLAAQRERERRQLNQRIRATLFKPQRRTIGGGAIPSLAFDEIQPLQDTLQI